MLNLDIDHDRKALALRIVTAIDAYAIKAYDSGPRNHLGASEIGKPCSRQIYYSFHWMRTKASDGRMQRLFQRGHREEKTFIEYIVGIGGEAYDIDPATGKQYRLSAVDGHFGGSLDSVIKLPWDDIPPLYFLGEYKTKGTGSGFNKLLTDGVRKANPTHFAQMSIYGKSRGFEYAIYFSVNKNDDHLHVEIVKLDFALADAMIAKAEYIVQLKGPPARIAESPAYMECKLCDFTNICHHGAPPARNCRSCTMALPVDGGEWQCSIVQQTIPPDFIKVGCAKWNPIV